MPELPDPAEYPNQDLGISGSTDANVGALNLLAGPLRLSNSANLATGCSLSCGTGVPTIGGNVADLYIRLDPAGDSTYLYRCTVAGVAGAATWAAISGA